MIHEVTHPFYVFSEDRTRVSQVIGFETDETGEIVEVFTEYGSVPPCQCLASAMLATSTEVAA